MFAVLTSVKQRAHRVGRLSVHWGVRITLRNIYSVLIIDGNKRHEGIFYLRSDYQIQIGKPSSRVLRVWFRSSSERCSINQDPVESYTKCLMNLRTTGCSTQLLFINILKYINECAILLLSLIELTLVPNRFIRNKFYMSPINTLVSANYIMYRYFAIIFHNKISSFCNFFSQTNSCRIDCYTLLKKTFDS
jgi:hypothetical protein